MFSPIQNSQLYLLSYLRAMCSCTSMPETLRLHPHAQETAAVLTCPKHCICTHMPKTLHLPLHAQQTAFAVACPKHCICSVQWTPSLHSLVSSHFVRSASASQTYWWQPVAYKCLSVCCPVVSLCCSLLVIVSWWSSRGWNLWLWQPDCSPDERISSVTGMSLIGSSIAVNHMHLSLPLWGPVSPSHGMTLSLTHFSAS